MSTTEFPITPLLPELLAQLQTHTRLVLEAPPGAGKTTQVPLALLQAPWLAGRRIIMLEPRRVAARSAALLVPITLMGCPPSMPGRKMPASVGPGDAGRKAPPGNRKALPPNGRPRDGRVAAPGLSG